MVQLEVWREKFEALGVKVAGMTYDDAAILVEFHQSQHLGYPLLRDEDAHHVNAFGILNEEYDAGHMAYGIPHPGVFFISPDGIITLKFAKVGYRSRPTMEVVLAAVSRQIQADG